MIADWLAAPELPDDPIDVAVLSRDPSVGAGVRGRPAGLARRLEAPDARGVPGRANEAVDAGPGFGDLPVLYVHGEADELVPMALAQPAVRAPARASDFTERIVPEARHEVFNELDQDETIGLVADFVDRVTAR